MEHDIGKRTDDVEPQEEKLQGTKTAKA